MKRWGLIFAICTILTLVAAPVAAQSKSVEMPRRDAEISIRPNGDVQVVETWEVKFIGGPFTTAYRSIPLNKVDSIDSWSVADETQSYQQVNKGSNKQPYTFEYTIGDGQMKATWFFPSTTDQTRTFKIGYTLHGALRIDPAGDQFYWKFIEADRGYTINSSNVTLHLPAKFDSSQLEFTTYQNGLAQSGAKMADAQALEFSGGPFGSGVEWEIRAQFPHGTLTASVPAWQANETRSIPDLNPRSAASSPQDQATGQNFVGTCTGVALIGLAAIFVVGFGSLLTRGRANNPSGSDDSSSSSDFGSSGSSGGDFGGGGSDGGGGGSSGFD